LDALIAIIYLIKKLDTKFAPFAERTLMTFINVTNARELPGDKNCTFSCHIQQNTFDLNFFFSDDYVRRYGHAMSISRYLCDYFSHAREAARDLRPNYRNSARHFFRQYN
jgi:hypothetical protein